MSNFFFSNSVFKRLALQTCKIQGLFGKGLIDIDVMDGPEEKEEEESGGENDTVVEEKVEKENEEKGHCQFVSTTFVIFYFFIYLNSIAPFAHIDSYYVCILFLSEVLLV